MVHMDRMLALYYMATMSNDRCAALPANGPKAREPKSDRLVRAPADLCPFEGKIG
jgi:hypothetical protein